MRLSHNKKILYIFIFFIFVSAVSLYSSSFTASVSSNNLSVGDQLQITFKVDKNKASGFKPPSFKGFSVLMGPSQSSYTQIINGNVSQSFSYSYVLRAEVPGTYEIAPAEINVDGGTLRSNSVKITVNKGQSGQQSAQGQGAANPNQNAQQSQQQQEKALSKEANDIISKHLFVRLNVNKNTAYKGEPVYATYRLYINPELNVLNAAAPKQPMFNGFWSQDFKIEQVQYTGSETINGITYRYADIAKVVLIPQQSGNLIIEPFEMEFVVRLRVQTQRQRTRDPWGFDDFFDDPFFGGASYRDFKYLCKSATGKLNVLPLPEPVPQNFTNAVGNYKFTASVDKNKSKTNEPISLKYKVEGSGNLKLVQAPILNLPKDLEQFEPKFTENISYSSVGMSGDKTFEYIIMPRAPGQYKIPPLTFVYFDYNQKRYFTINTEEFTLDVEKGNYQDYNAGNLQQGTDIKFIKDNTSFSRTGSNFTNSAWFYLFTLIPILAFIFLLLYKKKKENDKENMTAINIKNAAAYAKKRFTKASKFMDSGNIQEFYEEIHRSILEYFSNKFNMTHAELNKNTIKNTILESGNISAAQKSYKILEMCELARYTPDGGKVNAEEVLHLSKELITETEQKR